MGHLTKMHIPLNQPGTRKLSCSMSSMFFSYINPIVRTLSLPLSSHTTRRISLCKSRYSNMDHDDKTQLIHKRKLVTVRLCNVAGYKTDLLEIVAEHPKLHVLFIPGNPGVVSFYNEFLESLFELLGGTASVTAIGHISHTRKNWEHGRLFSLQDQIDHKVNFIEHELQNAGVPIYLVGHSIGSYIAMEMYRRYKEKVKYVVGLYPFVATDKGSATQSLIRNIAASSFLCFILGSIVGLLGMLPTKASKFLVKKTMGKSWSSSAVDALCSHVLQNHTVRNMLFMALTEFETLSETPDWSFLRENKDQIAFLFGNDDHWAPLHLFEEISKQVPGAELAIESEGHTHAFSCTEAGSLWVAHHVANLIKNH